MRARPDLTGSSFGPDKKISMNGSFNLYEVSLSDPNQIRPREFKYHKASVPVNFSDSTYDKLATLAHSSMHIFNNLMTPNSKFLP